MSFANEIKDFVSSFTAVRKSFDEQDTAAYRKRLLDLKSRELDIREDEINGANAGSEAYDRAFSRTDDRSENISGGAGDDTLDGNAGYDRMAARDAITKIESGGRYDALGPVTKKGDRAYGRYQVMGENIPEWTEAALGRRMTPKEFIRDRQAQDRVFDHRFGSYVKKYGTVEDAASAWFTGRPNTQRGNPRDALGTDKNTYVRKFAGAYRPRRAVEVAGFAAGGPVEDEDTIYDPESGMTYPRRHPQEVPGLAVDYDPPRTGEIVRQIVGSRGLGQQNYDRSLVPQSERDEDTGLSYPRVDPEPLPARAVDIVGENPGRGADDRILAEPDQRYPDTVGAGDIAGENPGRGSMGGRARDAGRGPGGAGARPTPKQAINVETPSRPTTKARGAREGAGAGAGGSTAITVTPRVAPSQNRSAVALQDGETLYTDPKTGVRYAIPSDGQQMRRLDAGDSLSSGLDAGIKFVSRAFGFDRGPSQAVGNDPKLVSFQRGEGAVSGREYKELTATVDPEGKMTPGQRNAAVIAAVKEHGDKTGRPQEAAQLIGGIMMAQRKTVVMSGTIAADQLQRGNMVAAMDTLRKAYDAVPDGNSVVFEYGDNGYTYKQLDSERRVLSEGPVTTEFLQKQVKLAASGRAYDDAVYKRVQEPPQQAASTDRAASTDAGNDESEIAPVGSSKPAGQAQSESDDIDPSRFPEPRPRIPDGAMSGLNPRAQQQFIRRFNAEMLYPWRERQKEWVADQKAKRADRINEQRRLDSQAREDRRVAAQLAAKREEEAARIRAERRKDPKQRAEDDLAAVDQRESAVAGTGVAGNEVYRNETGRRPEGAAVELTRRAIQPEMDAQRAEIGWDSASEVKRDVYERDNGTRRDTLSAGLDAAINIGKPDASGKIDKTKLPQIDEMDRERLLDLGERIAARNDMNPRTLMRIVHEMGMGGGGNIKVNPRTGEVLVDGGRERVYIDRQTLQQLALMRADKAKANAEAATAAEEKARAAAEARVKNTAVPTGPTAEGRRRQFMTDQFNEDRARLGIAPLGSR